MFFYCNFLFIFLMFLHVSVRYWVEFKMFIYVLFSDTHSRQYSCFVLTLKTRNPTPSKKVGGSTMQCPATEVT